MTMIVRRALAQPISGPLRKPLISLPLLLVVISAAASAQTPLNGSFENGLNDWTVAGAGRVDSITAADVGNQVTPTDGSRMAFLSTGPGDVGGPSTGFFDSIDANFVRDFNITTLSTTLDFGIFPAVLKFEWSFPSSEQDQGDNFDDIFDVLVDGNRVLSGSTNKPGGVSNFPDAPAGNRAQVVVGGGGVTAGSTLRFGVPDFTVFCAAIPGAIAGSNSFPLQFRVADQADTGFDSGLLVDNVRVDSNCGTPGTYALQQSTLSVNQQVEAKGGTLIVRSAQNRSPAASADGGRVVFIASADYGGGNPFLLEQAFLLENSAYTRLTNFTGDEIQAVEISSDGDWAVVAGRATPTDNLEIFRINLGSGDVAQITASAGCANTSPSINDNGRRIAFLTTCGSDISAGFNGDGNREMVVWDNGDFETNETSACQNFRPVVNARNSARYVAFASDCDYLGSNADGNVEIFRLDRNGAGSFIQITDTVDDVAVLDPVDMNQSGRYVVYIAQDGAGRYVVFRYDDSSDTSTFQGVSRDDRLIVNVSLVDTNSAEDIFYEAIDLFAIPPTPANLINHVDVATQIVTEGIANNGVLGIAAAEIGGVPHVYFSAADDLVGMNADGNLEIFQGRVE